MGEATPRPWVSRRVVRHCLEPIPGPGTKTYAPSTAKTVSRDGPRGGAGGRIVVLAMVVATPFTYAFSRLLS
jgi:hypothetical protein